MTKTEPSANLAPVTCRGKAYVISAPSGGGKTKLRETLLAHDQSFIFSVSATTRARRDNETHGVDYDFIDDTEFDRRIAAGEFLEYTKSYGGQRYGTPAKPILEALARGQDVLIDADLHGFKALENALPGDVAGVFIHTSLAVLEPRLRAREALQESPNYVKLEERIRKAPEVLKEARDYHHMIDNNGTPEQTFAQFEAVIAEERAIAVATLPGTQIEEREYPLQRAQGTFRG